MAEDGVADDPTHDEPDPSGIGPVVTQDMDDQEVAAAASARADHQSEVTTAGEPMGRGKHGRGSRAGVEPRGLRPPVSCGPCGDVRTGCCARHGCACAAGIRAPCGGGGCSAGTYACSRALSDGGQGRSRRRRPDRPLATDSAGRGSVKGSGLRPAPPTHAPVERPRDEPGRSVDMRHPSTPGDRGTVRAASPRRQIATGAWTGGPAAVDIHRTTGRRPRVPSGPDSLWIASCSARATGVMFDPRRVSPRSGRTRIPGSSQSVSSASSGPLTCGDPVSAGPL